LQARIIAIADSYDTMTSDRTYRKRLRKKEAIDEIRRNSGKQFDPEIVKIFTEKVLGEVE
jgi:HD-GYP domain-containing protein (c-di-GMP phosphodiesterase class II)